MSPKTSSVQADVTPPLSLKTLQKYVQEIFGPIKRKECVSTVWLPMLGRRIRNKFIISYPQLFEPEIGQIDKYLLVYVEPLELTEESNTGYIKLIAKSILESYSNRQKQDQSLPDIGFDDSAQINYAQSLESLNQLIKQITAQGLEIVLFLGEFDELEFANQVFYNNLKSLWVKSNSSLHFVFLLLTDVAQPESIKKFGELNELVLRNVVYVPLLANEDINYLLDYYSNQLNRPFSTEEKNLLQEICGGHPYLLKACARLIALMNGERLDLLPSLKELLINHFEPRSACQKIFNLLSPGEQEILRKVVKNGQTTKLPVEASTLAKLGLIKQAETGVWQPFGELFQSVIEQEQEPAEESLPHSGGVSFDEKSGAIFVGNKNVEEKFTRQEYEILSFLLKEPNKLRSRDEVSEAMWGKEAYDKYSDWAIDQVMSKIRKKLQSVGAQKALVTVRGRGYKLSI